MERPDELLAGQLKYLRLLSRDYPTIEAASAEIINLLAVQKLPKGTEHFMSDLHGEYEAFTHILNSASGVIREKVDKVLGDSVSPDERAAFATLIYYPSCKLPVLLASAANRDVFYKTTLMRLLDVCRLVSSKHTRSFVRQVLPENFAYILDELLHAHFEDHNKEAYYGCIIDSVLVSSKHTRSFVRQVLPENFAYILDELLHAHFEDHNKEAYYGCIIDSVIGTGQADAFIKAMCALIKTLAVYRLHIVGDIFDRGPRPDIILDELMAHHSVDIQWGNHDVVWMGAASGSPICVATVLHTSLAYYNTEFLEDGYGISLRPLATFADRVVWMGAASGSPICVATVLHTSLAYYNTEFLEDGYGISLRPLATFADRVYAGCSVARFYPKTDKTRGPYPEEMLNQAARMRKAIAVIMFKLECEVIDRNPDFEMQDRDFLRRIDYSSGTVCVDGKRWPLLDTDLPTVDLACPERLTQEEQQMLSALCHSFRQSEKLNRHVRFLYDKGGVYRVENGNLLFHGAVPLTESGSFAVETFEKHGYAGRALMDYCDSRARRGYFSPDGTLARQSGQDFLWYLWCGKLSPLFGRHRMATFENLFIGSPECSAEIKNPYYRHINDSRMGRMVLEEFGLPASSHIINGHVPVRASHGETPVKAGGRLIVIDGGFCRAYHEKTGIAGYTLVYNSRGMSLRVHRPFESAQKAIDENIDILSTVDVFETTDRRMLIQDTDEGAALRDQIEGLQQLVCAYRTGLLRQTGKKG